MLPELIPLAHQYAVGDRFLTLLTGDFADADWLTRDATGHDARWIVGHLAVTRDRCVGMMGLPPRSAGWHQAVMRGTRPEGVFDSVFGPELAASFHAAHQLMVGRWEALTASDIAAPLGRTLPDGADTIGGALRFLAWHEAYHCGQLGLIRRLVGKPGIA